ncbi:MAG: hypothetical protein EOO71_02090 [Myxococcaceae bacterium]|nr:MAG: hypothetical protein EOO71_02090 [Myxococcaceae bacterium]
MTWWWPGPPSPASPTGAPGRCTTTPAASGLSWFPSSGLRNAKSTALAIASPAVLSGVTTVLAQQDSSRVSVWAVDGSQRLFSLNNAVGATSGWSVPLQQREHVARLAPRRNQKRSTGELFVASTDNSLITYLWQDPSTTTWQNTDMVLPSLANGQEFPCYTTVVRFTDAQGTPIVGQTVRLNASEWSRVIVNGYWTDLDDSTRVEVKTDGSGTVTLINKVTDVGTPVFHFSAPFLASTVTADPSAELRANLVKKLQSQDLSQWKKPDGSPVVPPGTNPELVAQAQAALQQLMANMDSLPTDGSAAPLETATTPAPKAMALAQPSFKVLGTVTNAIETAAGDVLQALKSAAGVIYEYAIQPLVSGTRTLLQFFVKIGEQVVTFVVRTVKEALQLISWLFQQLAVLIEDIIQFLGFLFAWDDILATQKALETMAQDVVLALSARLKSEEPSIVAFFDDLISKWDGICTTALGLPDVTTQQVVAQTQAAQTPEQASAMDCLTTSPGATFSTYQVSHGGIADSTSTESDPPVVQAITDFLQTVGNILSDVADGVKELCQGLQTMVQQGTFSMHGFVKLLAGEAAKTLLAAARDLLVGLCEIISDVTPALLQDVLLRPFNIPVLSWLYKKLTGEDSLTMLGALSLLAAIPTTIAFKLVTGEAPIPAGAGDQKTQARVQPEYLPWRHPTTLVLAAKDKSHESTSADRYSVLGGILATISSLLNTFLLAAGQLAKGPRTKRGLSTAQAAASWLGVAGSFPFDDDRGQQILDRLLWVLSALEAVVTGLVALMSWGRGADADAKGLAKALEMVDSVLIAFIGVISMVLSLVSYVLEMAGQGDSPSYHSYFWDTEKFAANLLGFGGMTAEGAVSVISTPSTQVTVLLVAAGAEGVAFLLDGARWFETAWYNQQNNDKKLYQFW